jgi:small-conductance mechanosensitive channel
MPEMSQRAFARHLGVTHRAVQKAIEAKRISLNANKKIDSDVMTAAWARNTDESKRSMEDLSRVRRPNVGIPDDLADDEPDFPAAASTKDPSLDEYRRHRAARERQRAERELIELEQLRGNMVPLADAQRVVFTAFRTLRDAVMNIPVRVKDQLAAEVDPHRVESMLDAELAGALEAIDVGKILADELREDNDGGHSETAGDD